MCYVKPTQQLHIEEGTKQKDTSDNRMQESLKKSLTCLFHFVNCTSDKPLEETNYKSNKSKPVSSTCTGGSH